MTCAIWMSLIPVQQKFKKQLSIWNRCLKHFCQMHSIHVHCNTVSSPIHPTGARTIPLCDSFLSKRIIVIDLIKELFKLFWVENSHEWWNGWILDDLNFPTIAIFWRQFHAWLKEDVLYFLHEHINNSHGTSKATRWNFYLLNFTTS